MAALPRSCSRPARRARLMSAPGLRVTESEISSTRLCALAESTARPMRASLNIETTASLDFTQMAAAILSSLCMSAGLRLRLGGGGGDGSGLYPGQVPGVFEQELGPPERVVHPRPAELVQIHAQGEMLNVNALEHGRGPGL